MLNVTDITPGRQSGALYVSAALGIGLGVMPSTGDAFGVMVTLMGLIALAFLRSPRVSPPVFSWAMLFALQYLAVQFALNWYHEGVLFGNAFQENYLFILLGGVCAGVLLSLPLISPAGIIKFIPLGLLAAVLLLAIDYFTGWLGDSNANPCRVYAFSGNPQWPAAALLAVFTPLLAWEIGRGRVSRSSYGLTALLFVSFSAFTGARMAYYGFALQIALLIVLLLWRRAPRQAAGLMLAAVLGVSTGIVIDVQSGCNFSARLGQQVTLAPKVVQMLGLSTQQSITMAEDAAISSAGDELYYAGGARAQFWNNAIEAFPKSPFIGYGQQADGPIAAIGLPAGQAAPHMHNQFLSWAIWGGVIGLGSGLMLLLGPIITARQKLPAIFYALSWGLVGFSESIFSFPMGLGWCVLGLLFFERLFQAADSPGNS